MPKRKPIKTPDNKSGKSGQVNEEFDLDAITDSLANKPYSQNVDPGEPEPTFRTSIDVPESLMNKINIDVFTNKMKKRGPKSNRGVVLDALRFYYENRTDPDKT